MSEFRCFNSLQLAFCFRTYHFHQHSSQVSQLKLCYNNWNRSYFNENKTFLSKYRTELERRRIDVGWKISQKTLTSVYLKIFLNYSKLASLILSFQNNWSINFKGMLSFLSFFTLLNKVNPSIECIIAGKIVKQN